MTKRACRWTQPTESAASQPQFVWRERRPNSSASRSESACSRVGRRAERRGERPTCLPIRKARRIFRGDSRDRAACASASRWRARPTHWAETWRRAADIVAQPAMQRAEFAAGDFVRNFRMGLERRGIKLRRQNIAYGVALKRAADAAGIPVHVLQAAVAIVGRRDAEIGFHARAPRLRQILHRELAFQHFQLEIEAQHDVEIVGHLVGVGADERTRHLVDGAVKGLERHVREPIGEGDPAAADRNRPRSRGCAPRYSPTGATGFHARRRRRRGRAGWRRAPDRPPVRTWRARPRAASKTARRRGRFHARGS